MERPPRDIPFSNVKKRAGFMSKERKNIRGGNLLTEHPKGINTYPFAWQRQAEVDSKCNFVDLCIISTCESIKSLLDLDAVWTCLGHLK